MGECNSTLQAFACYESFHRCDAQGFMVGTCRDACDAVVYECVNWFESVDLEHYNCTSHRYLDSRAQTCTGNNDFISFNDQAQLFLGEEPELLLYTTKKKEKKRKKREKKGRGKGVKKKRKKGKKKRK